MGREDEGLMAHTYRRNVIVGIVVLGALVALAWMAIKFGAQPAMWLGPKQATIHFTTLRADGLDEGSNVTFLGVTVGSVQKVTRKIDYSGVTVDALIRTDPPLPANVKGEILMTNPIGGVATLALVVDGTPTGVLQDGATISAEYVGSTFLPPEFSRLAGEATKTLQEVRASGAISKFGAALDSAREKIDNAGKLIEDLTKIVGDEKLVADLKQSMAHINEVSASAERISKNLETIPDRVTAIADHTDKTLANANAQITRLSDELVNQMRDLGALSANLKSITQKIDKGEGTAGLLVNDPRLYKALVDSMSKVDLAVGDARRLIQQIESEGFYFNLGSPKK